LRIKRSDFFLGCTLSGSLVGIAVGADNTLRHAPATFKTFRKCHVDLLISTRCPRP
jgi:hypothetical protein